MSLRGFFGRIVGQLEMFGLRFPVTHYHAWVANGVLLRGSRLTDDELLGLMAAGVRSIVNLCAENDDDLRRQFRLGLYPALRVEHFPVLDNTALTRKQIDYFLSWVSDKGNQPCYVHCEAGKGRTGVAVACYRISRGWSLSDALAEARSFGMTLPEQIKCVEQYAARA